MTLLITIAMTLFLVFGPGHPLLPAAKATESASATTSAGVVKVDTVEVEIVPPDRDSKTLQNLVHEIIVTPANHIFSAQDIDRAVSNLKSSGLFENIHVDTKDDFGRTTLLFRLTPYGLIKEISFHGAFPLLEETILHAMTIAVGSPFIEKNLTQQSHFIEQLYRHNGFIDPDVPPR